MSERVFATPTPDFDEDDDAVYPVRVDGILICHCGCEHE